MNIKNIILNEFTCYYGVDELPNIEISNYMENEIPFMAIETAARLRRIAQNESMNELIYTFQNMHNEKTHPLVIEIENKTLMSWTDSQEIWEAFQRLLELIIINLK